MRTPTGCSCCVSTWAVARSASWWPASARTTSPRRWSGARWWWSRTSSPRSYAASRARAWCWPPPKASAWSSSGPTTRSPRERSSVSERSADPRRGPRAGLRRPVRAYSRGMAQRLALARALLHGPDLLLLDEPFAGLDPEAVAALQHRLGELRAAGHAIVLTTHDLERAAPVATRLAILHRGRVAWTQEGAPEPVVVAAAWQAVVVGRA